MISTSSILISLSMAAVAVAQSVPASASSQDLGLVAAQYNASGYADVSNTGLGVPLNDPTALVTVAYTGAGIVSNGQPYPASAVNTVPRIYVTPASGSVASFSNSNAFTVILADAGAIGAPDPRGNYRHYLANGCRGAAPTSGNTTFVPQGCTVVTNYAGPGPAAGEGPHRYAWLVFAQPGDFAQPAGDFTQPGPWNVSQYVSESRLGSLVGSSFFTVENGQASYQVAPTSAVSSVASSALPTAGRSSAASGSGASSGAGPSASASSGSSGDASVSRVISLAGVALAGVAALVAASL